MVCNTDSKIENTQMLTFFLLFCFMETSCSNISFFTVDCLHALKEHTITLNYYNTDT